MYADDVFMQLLTSSRHGFGFCWFRKVASNSSHLIKLGLFQLIRELMGHLASEGHSRGYRQVGATCERKKHQGWSARFPAFREH